VNKNLDKIEKAQFFESEEAFNEYNEKQRKNGCSPTKSINSYRG
jgi:hypothetical protein